MQNWWFHYGKWKVESGKWQGLKDPGLAAQSAIAAISATTVEMSGVRSSSPTETEVSGCQVTCARH
jgi:hypothetical protein